MDFIKERIGFGFWLFIISIAVVGLLIWGSVAYNKSTIENYTAKTSREVALACTLDMYTKFHIHPVLKIVIDGQSQVIPANIGIRNACMNAIHTHDATGLLHVEAPVKKDFTLGDFFAVWQKEFNKDQILDSKVDKTHTITLTVNDQPVDTFENTILVDKDNIVIEYK